MDEEFSSVRLPCRVCGEDVVRSSVDGAWVHADEFIHLDNVASNFDHEAELDVIEVDEESGRRPRARRNFPEDPFSPIHFS